ncbi:PQQ-binding-like beta-propeller repeat protein [soil metagenome]
MNKQLIAPLLVAALAVPVATTAGDWPTWGGGPQRDMASDETGIPIDFDPGEYKKGTEEIDLATTKHARWVAKLGSSSYGTPTVADGQVYVGTNNEVPRNSAEEGDRGIVMCFDEKTGAFKWQLVVPKLGAGKVSDWEYLGICSTPTIVGDRGYVVTNRCEILCLDTKGMSDGNQGMEEEDVYMAGMMEQFGQDPASVDRSGLRKPGSEDADIIWRYDFRDELGVFPHNIASSYPLVIDGKVFVTTSNGVDWSHLNIPAPQAPSLVMLDAETGELLGEQKPLGDPENWEGTKILHCSWSSPAYAQIGGNPMVFFGGGNGWVYGLSPETETDEEGYDILKELWRFDANAPEYRQNEEGDWKKYIDFDGPSEVIGTPVVSGGKVFVGIGQDPEHGEGVGRFVCIDPTMEGDISGKQVWEFKEIERTVSTAAIVDGLVYIPDYTGRIFCLDEKTGEEYWRHDTKGHIWACPLAVDGHVYVGNEEGELTVLKMGKELEVVDLIEFNAPLYSNPVAANGVIYVTTHTHLYAFAKE